MVLWTGVLFESMMLNLKSIFEVEDILGKVVEGNSATRGDTGVFVQSGKSTPFIVVLCAPGYEGEWDQGCVPYKSGYHKDSRGTQGCLQCDKGSFSKTITVSSCTCTECDVGSFSISIAANSSFTSTYPQTEFHPHYQWEARPQVTAFVSQVLSREWTVCARLDCR